MRALLSHMHEYRLSLTHLIESILRFPLVTRTACYHLPPGLTDISKLREGAARHAPLTAPESPQSARVCELRLFESEELVVLHGYPPQPLGQLYGGQLKAQ